MNIYDHFSSKDVVNSEIDISCIGAFDGLHLGHLELIKSTFNCSNNFQIITFDTLPKIFFNKKLKPILMIDDMFDRLDMSRIGNIANMMMNGEFGQVFITDTDEKRVNKILTQKGKSVIRV